MRGADGTAVATSSAPADINHRPEAGATSAGAKCNFALPTPLTRSRVSKDKRLLWLPSSQRWINDTNKRKLKVKSRRIGITYIESYDAVSARKTGRATWKYWYTCTDKDAAREFIEYCHHWAGLKERVAERVLEYEAPEGPQQCWAFVCHPTPETTITAMPSRPAAIRGKDGDWGADEAAHHPDFEAMWRAGVSVTKWHGTARVWSSHDDEGTVFNRFDQNCRRVLQALSHDPDHYQGGISLDEMARQARTMHIRPVLSYHRTTIVDAIAEGFVELYNAITGAHYTRASFLQECQDECLSDDHYNREYMCIPCSDLTAALKYHVIDACTSDTCPQPVDGFEQLDEALRTLAKHYTGGPIFAGVDIGDTGDLTAFWLLEPVGDVLWTRLLYRMRNESMVDQENAAKRLFEHVKLGRCAVLRRGVGVGIHAHLERKYGAARVAGIDETRPIKIGLVTGLVQAFEDRRMRIPSGEQLKEALHSMREIRTPGGQVSYDAPRRKTGHADEFMAAAGAVDAAGCAMEPFAFMVNA